MQLRVLAAAARELGDGTLQLTDRAGLQLSGISETSELDSRLTTAGLCTTSTSAPTHTILCSPLSGRVGGQLDVRGWPSELEERLRAHSRLPEDFLVSVDDGRMDVSGLAADVGLHVVQNTLVAVLLTGRDTGLRVAPEQSVDAAAAVARSVAHVDGPGTDLEAVLVDVLGRQRVAVSEDRLALQQDRSPPVGWLAHPDGSGTVTLGAAVPAGRLDARVAEFLAAVEKPLIITPWRSILLCDLEEWPAEQVVRVLAPMGLVFDASYSD